MFGRPASNEEEIPKDKFVQKEKTWKKAISEDAEEEASSTLSDISASTDGDIGDYLGSLDERSEDYQRFEKSLRIKHSKACKAMSVSCFPCHLTCIGCQIKMNNSQTCRYLYKNRVGHIRKHLQILSQFYRICWHDMVSGMNV